MNTFKRKALSTVVLGALCAAATGCNSLNPDHGVMCVAGRGYGLDGTVLVIGKEFKAAAVMTNSHCEVSVAGQIAVPPPQSMKPSKEILQ
jgi:hypothetical protein